MINNPFDPGRRQRRFGDPDLTRRILDRTSGAACARAEELLGGSWDQDLEPVAAELLRRHCERCQQCRQLAAVLADLQPLLPELAEREPGRSFTAAVLSATSGQRLVAGRVGTASGPLGRLEALALWLQASLQRAWDRPRFALEAAWVAAALVSLLVYSPLVTPLVTPQGPARLGQAVQAGFGVVPEVVEAAEDFCRGAVSRGGQLISPAVDWTRLRLRDLQDRWTTLTGPEHEEP